VSKHGPCDLSHHNEPAIAWWKTGNDCFTRLCWACLDCWFDNADDDPDLEPTAWGWLVHPEPAAADVAAWIRDSRNHHAVAEVLHREARINPSWLRTFIDRENRARRRVRV
jgi:hypothetical protein